MNQELRDPWDDYFLPNSNVLRNKLGETSKEELSAAEEFFTFIRFGELQLDPLPGSYDYDHFKAIHRHLFSDVYDWAGEERLGPLDGCMQKAWFDVVDHDWRDPATPWVYYDYPPAGEGLSRAAEQQFDRIREMDYLRGYDRNQFVERLADVWCEVNTIHPFREGNTRAQAVFFSQLAEQAGWHIPTVSFLRPGSQLRDEFLAARFYHQATGSAGRMEAVLERTVLRREPRAPMIEELRAKVSETSRSRTPPAKGRERRQGYER